MEHLARVNKVIAPLCLKAYTFSFENTVYQYIPINKYLYRLLYQNKMKEYT